jgi:hypothetical protein
MNDITRPIQYQILVRDGMDESEMERIAGNHSGKWIAHHNTHFGQLPKSVHFPNGELITFSFEDEYKINKFRDEMKESGYDFLEGKGIGKNG